MSVRLDTEGTIRLEGSCSIEDAESLVQLRLQHPAAPVDWSACDHAHTAVVQVLLVDKPTMKGPPADLFLKTWVEPAMADAKD